LQSFLKIISPFPFSGNHPASPIRPFLFQETTLLNYFALSFFRKPSRKTISPLPFSGNLPAKHFSQFHFLKKCSGIQLHAFKKFGWVKKSVLRKIITFEKNQGMNAITIDNAISNFPQIVTNTIRNVEETVIVGEQGAVVLVSQQEWNSIMETLRLFRDKKSLKALLDGHSARRKGQRPKSETVNQAFQMKSSKPYNSHKST